MYFGLAMNIKGFSICFTNALYVNVLHYLINYLYEIDPWTLNIYYVVIKEITFVRKFVKRAWERLCVNFNPWKDQNVKYVYLFTKVVQQKIWDLMRKLLTLWRRHQRHSLFKYTYLILRKSTFWVNTGLYFRNMYTIQVGVPQGTMLIPVNTLFRPLRNELFFF